MNTLLNDERDHYTDDRDDDRAPARDREITLGTMTILGIFFALAVLCAAFFGFGYSTGRRQPTTVATTPNTALSGNYSGPALKPSAGNTTDTTIVSAKPSPEPVTPDAIPAAPPKPIPVTRNTPEIDPADGAIVGVPMSGNLSPKPAAATPPAIATTPSPAANGTFMVQVAAVSHQEDADLLVTTLKRVHYNVAVHNEPQDKLLHVQIGPFTSRADAQAMRQRLLGDGFNAIVK